MTAIPDAGTDIEILYSEKNPLRTTNEIDDEAYFIYFTIIEAQGDILVSAPP